MNVLHLLSSLALGGGPQHPERFWAKVDTSGDCWLWLGAIGSSGYGGFTVRSGLRGNRVTFGAHRVAYEFAHGPIPEGVSVLHRCDVPACVRPDHLFLGTQRDNIIDMMRKGRHIAPKGERNGHARLTWDQVHEIRAESGTGASTRGLSERFGVCERSIRKIVAGQRWASAS